ncbi:hypothetical protein BDB00DRAFT_826081 [Zychaea mexicana]|uniref:uncharacterized protein n=1 Tax=Zychaea mexicana TaxID=64656 RepID=UPI0022FEA203|nr:uncharacterized protein BDB00DRAFT_826081 [Zychaea mexicana]KAI9492900.1 hypothetical protein BDB00DRAFT_826081 [Zychaea mexicana]
MKLKSVIVGLLLSTATSALAAAADLACSEDAVAAYTSTENTASTLQGLIDEAALSGDPVVNLFPGQFILSADEPVQLKPGVSLHATGFGENPTILTGPKEANLTATIKVPAKNKGWSIKGIVFDNVNIEIEPHTNGDESSVLGNLFLNGGRGSIISYSGENLYIDGNVFLRDFEHRGTVLIPKNDTTNAGVVFQTQKSSVVSNNIFGMDLRHLDDVYPHVAPQVQTVLTSLRFVQQCLGRDLDDQQGFLASGVQMYFSNDITIRENILNGTLPDTITYGQDHAISIVGSNQTYIYQNFFGGWQIGDFGGATRFTSAVDAFVVSNYLANNAVMMYAAVHADFMQVSNMVVHNNFFYKFLGEQVATKDKELDGWLYEGVTFFDFYTARLNYTIRPPIWNSSVPISPWGWHIVVSDNKFGAADGLDPNVISLGNLDLEDALVDRKNCYVTDPLVPGSSEGATVPIVWRQTFEPGIFTRYGGKVPKHFDIHTDKDLMGNTPAHLRNLPIPSFWKAFTLANDTIPMMDPSAACIA